MCLPVRINPILLMPIILILIPDAVGWILVQVEFHLTALHPQAIVVLDHLARVGQLARIRLSLNGCKGNVRVIRKLHLLEVIQQVFVEPYPTLQLQRVFAGWVVLTGVSTVGRHCSLQLVVQHTHIFISSDVPLLFVRIDNMFEVVVEVEQEVIIHLLAVDRHRCDVGHHILVKPDVLHLAHGVVQVVVTEPELQLIITFKTQVPGGDDFLVIQPDHVFVFGQVDLQVGQVLLLLWVDILLPVGDEVIANVLVEVDVQ